MSCAVAPLFSHPALLPPTPPPTPPVYHKPLPAAPVGKKQTSPRTPSSPLSPTGMQGRNVSKGLAAASKALAGAAAPGAPGIGAASASATALGAGLGLGTAQRPPVVHSYAMLRAYHATAIKYMIAKLRWEQAHNGYIIGADAWEKHINVINILEDELVVVEHAQKGLDRFPNCHYPVADPKLHGPMTLEDVVHKETKEWVRDKIIDRELQKQFPFFKQLFVGPMTKYQARAQVELREILMSGEIYPDDLEELLPTENFKMAMGEPVGPKAAALAAAAEVAAGRKPPGPAAPRPKKLTYDEARLERENAQIAKDLLASGTPLPPTHPYVITEAEAKRLSNKEGPMTQEEYFASLPKYGPKTKAEAMLPLQREQRGMILAWMRQPWPEWDEEAAGLIHKLGNVAFARLEERAGGKTKDKGKEKERQNAKDDKGGEKKTMVEGKKTERQTKADTKTKVDDDKDKGEAEAKVSRGREEDKTAVPPVEKREPHKGGEEETGVHAHTHTQPGAKGEAGGEEGEGEGEITILATTLKLTKVDTALEAGTADVVDVVEEDEEGTVVDVVEITFK